MQARETLFPYLYRVALDLLPVQASGVPSERTFSSCKETDTMRRNGLDAAMFEILQVLKYSMKRERLEFPAGWQPAQEEELGIEAPVGVGAGGGDSAAQMLSEFRFDDFLALLDQSDTM